jgi:uncharacterized membrane protein (DUF2068 family)
VPGPERRAPARDVGVGLIVAYKLAKGAAEAALSLALLVALERGLADSLHRAAHLLREHLVARWSTHLADLLLGSITPGHLALLDLGLALDAALTLVEGFALHRRRWWAPWLIAAATASLLPFEVASLYRSFHLGRGILLAVNLAVVGYLLWRARRERRA